MENREMNTAPETVEFSEQNPSDVKDWYMKNHSEETLAELIYDVLLAMCEADDYANSCEKGSEEHREWLSRSMEWESLYCTLEDEILAIMEKEGFDLSEGTDEAVNAFRISRGYDKIFYTAEAAAAETAAKMKKEKYTYYRVKHNGMIAKKSDWYYWIYENGEWVRDTKSVISDMIHGYDSGEPEDSPYGYGSTSVMDEIEEISYEEAMEKIAADIIANLIFNWRKKFRKAKQEWDENPGWPAKHVTTSFTLFNCRYTLVPDDFGFTKGTWDEGFMESIQTELEKDLKEAGASEIESYGFLD